MSTYKQEATTIHQLCEAAQAHHFRAVRVFNEEGDSETVENTKQTIEGCTCQESATILFTDGNGHEFRALYIGGNGPECITDFAYTRHLEPTIDAICDVLYAHIDRVLSGQYH